MKKIYIIVVTLLLAIPVLAQKIKGVELTSTLNSKLDTNTAVYDEAGNKVSHSKYVELVYSGYYATRISGDPQNPESKLYIKKLSSEEQLASVERISKDMAARSSSLELNKELDLTPLYTKLTDYDLDDKVKVLIFWSSECVSCTESFAYINDVFLQSYNPDKAIILAITTENSLPAQVKLMQKPLLHAKLISNGRMITNFYHLNTYPTFVIADRDNVIRFAVSGTSPQVISAFKTQLRTLLK